MGRKGRTLDPTDLQKQKAKDNAPKAAGRVRPPRKVCPKITTLREEDDEDDSLDDFKVTRPKRTAAAKAAKEAKATTKKKVAAVTVASSSSEDSRSILRDCAAGHDDSSSDFVFRHRKAETTFDRIFSFDAKTGKKSSDPFSPDVHSRNSSSSGYFRSKDDGDDDDSLFRSLCLNEREAEEQERKQGRNKKPPSPPSPAKSAGAARKPLSTNQILTNGAISHDSSAKSQSEGVLPFSVTSPSPKSDADPRRDSRLLNQRPRLSLLAATPSPFTANQHGLSLVTSTPLLKCHVTQRRKKSYDGLPAAPQLEEEADAENKDDGRPQLFTSASSPAMSRLAGDNDGSSEDAQPMLFDSITGEDGSSSSCNDGRSTTKGQSASSPQLFHSVADRIPLEGQVQESAHLFDSMQANVSECSTALLGSAAGALTAGDGAGDPSRDLFEMESQDKFASAVSLLEGQEGDVTRNGKDIFENDSSAREVLKSLQSLSVKDGEEEEEKKPSSRKTMVRFGAIENQPVNRSMSNVLEDSLDDVLSSSVVIAKGGKKWRRTLFMANNRRASSTQSMGGAEIRRRQMYSYCPTTTTVETTTTGTTTRHSELVVARKHNFVPPSKASIAWQAIGEEQCEKNGTPYRRSHSSLIITPSKARRKQSEISEAAEDAEAPAPAPLLEKQAALTTEEKVLARCSKHEVVPFGQLYDDEVFLTAKKIGEGSYGEVFLLPQLLPAATASTPAPVLKVVPVDGSVMVNGDVQTRLDDMLAEIAVSTELSRLCESGKAVNFVQVLDCYLTSGFYPSTLLDHWDAFDDERGSENDRPDGQLLPEGQKFIALVFSNGGKDLEAIELTNAAKGLSVFWQVAHALAVAEVELQFEHRDLHWGNILVRDEVKSDPKTLEYRLNGRTFKVKTEKVRATIIDFSLSRMTTTTSDGSDVGGVDECDIFNDLAKDQELFKPQGDYQFDIYRMMKEETCDQWSEFHPKTNVFWLHYLLDKLLKEVPYKTTKTQLHRKAVAKLRSVKAKIMEFPSAEAFVMEEGTEV